MSTERYLRKHINYGPTDRDLNTITLYSFGPTGKPGGDAVGYLPTG